MGSDDASEDSQFCCSRRFRKKTLHLPNHFTTLKNTNTLDPSNGARNRCSLRSRRRSSTCLPSNCSVSSPHMASPSTVRNVHDGLYWLSTFDYIQLHIKIMINKPEPRTRSKRFCLRCLKKILNTSASSTIQVSTKNYCMIARESDCLERISGSKRTTAAEIPDRADSCVTGCALSVLPEGHPVQRAVLCPVQKKSQWRVTAGQ